MANNTEESMKNQSHQGRHKRKRKIPAPSKTDIGWAWLILISAHLTLLLLDGTVKSFAVLLPTLQEQFLTRAWIIGSIIALLNAVKDFTAPAVGILTHKFDSRVLAVTGAILTVAGIIGASVATNVVFLTLCVSILNGIGFGLLSIPALTLLGKYFDRLYPFASGIAYSGISVGIIILSPLTQFLLDTYGWRNALLLLGAICLHGVVAAALLRPFQDSQNQTANNNITISVISCAPSQLAHDDGYDSKSDKGTRKNTPKTPGSWCRRILHSSGLSLFGNSSFVAAIFMMSCDSFSKTGWVVYFVPHCIVKGLTPQQASLSATVVGLANLVGRFIYIPFVSRNIISIRKVLYISGTISAITLAVDMWTDTLPTIVIANGLYALGAGVLKPLCDVHIKMVVGQRCLSEAFGWRMALNGVFRVIAGFSLGWLYEQTGSYDGGFFLLGAVHGAGVLVFAAEHVYRTMRNHGKKSKLKHET